MLSVFKVLEFRPAMVTVFIEKFLVCLKVFSVVSKFICFIFIYE